MAILLGPPNADAASIMASADATGQMTRKKIVAANPFLETFDHRRPVTVTTVTTSHHREETLRRIKRANCPDLPKVVQPPSTGHLHCSLGRRSG